MSHTRFLERRLPRLIAAIVFAGAFSTAVGLPADALPAPPPDTAAEPITPQAVNPVAIANAAWGQVGVGEDPPGSNCNPYSSWWGLGCQPWCADFAKWAWWAGQAHIDGIDSLALSFYNYGQAWGTWRDGLDGYQQVGDAVVYRVGGTWEDDHVGIIVEYDAYGTWVVSGNAGPNTDQVYFHNAFDIGGLSGYTRPVG